MKGRYGKIRLDPVFLGDIYKLNLTHVFFSSITILDCTEVYDLTSGNRPVKKEDLKYTEYFCTSDNFEIFESDSPKTDAPTYCFKMDAEVGDGTTETIFRKNIKFNWEQITLEDD